MSNEEKAVIDYLRNQPRPCCAVEIAKALNLQVSEAVRICDSLLQSHVLAVTYSPYER